MSASTSRAGSCADIDSAGSVLAAVGVVDGDHLEGTARLAPISLPSMASVRPGEIVIGRPMDAVFGFVAGPRNETQMQPAIGCAYTKAPRRLVFSVQIYAE